MKIVLPTLLLIVIAGAVCGQNTIDDSPTSIRSFEKYLLNSVRYPAVARENRFSGQIIVAFWVNEDKSISDIKILKGLEDNFSCEDEVIRKIKTFRPGLSLKPDEYIIAFTFVIMNNDDEEIHDYNKVKNLISYKNFLFEAKITGFSTKLKRIISDEVISYKIPTFTDHVGKLKALKVSALLASPCGEIYKDSLYTKSDQKFNQNGDLIESSFYNSNSTFKTIYSYSQSGNSGSERLETVYRENGEVFSKAVTKFNSAKQITEDNGKIFEYDDRGLEVSESAYNDNHLIEKKIFKYIAGKKRFVEGDNLYLNGGKTLMYFDNGMLTESYTYKSDEGLVTKELFKYDSKDELEAEILYDAEGKLLWTNTYGYDAKGNKIEEVKYVSDYAPAGTRSTFQYLDYDKKGNWHTAKWLDGNTRKFYIVKREIIY